MDSQLPERQAAVQRQVHDPSLPLWSPGPRRPGSRRPSGVAPGFIVGAGRGAPGAATSPPTRRRGADGSTASPTGSPTVRRRLGLHRDGDEPRAPALSAVYARTRSATRPARSAVSVSPMVRRHAGDARATDGLRRTGGGRRARASSTARAWPRTFRGDGPARRTPTTTAAASTTRSAASPATAASAGRGCTTARARHIYNTIRPILHEPGPIANGTYGS